VNDYFKLLGSQSEHYLGKALFNNINNKLQGGSPFFTLIPASMG
jgi:hypothetical protein